MKTPVQIIMEVIRKGEAETLPLLESVLVDQEKRVLDSCFESSRLAHPNTGFLYGCFEDWYQEYFPQDDSKHVTVNKDLEGPHYESGDDGYGDLDDPTQ